MMSKGRLEAFSDGVIAILITIMVLELQVPEGGDLHALREVVPALLAYVLSFVILGIYWNNHHHMLHATDRVNGAILWANLHLLFWLSLVPAVTAWLGETYSAPVPTAAYGSVMFLSAIAYTILQNTIVRHQGHHARLAAAIGNDAKGKASLTMYALAIPLAFVNSWIANAIYVSVALMWLIPDRRIEAVLGGETR
jgi:uncharacterized membrane protein